MAEVLYAEVTGSANGVVTSLERLQTTLGTLQTRFSTATTAAGGFANAILGIKAPASAAGLSSLSRSISSIANASSKLQASAPMLGKALSSVSLAVNNMPAVNPESVASITAMGTAFKGLGNSLARITKYAESAGIALLGLVNSANGLPALNASATKTLSLLRDIAPVAARGSTALSKLGVASERMGKQAYSGGNGLFHLLSMAKRYVITGIVIHMISSISQAISSAMSDSAAWIEDMNYFNVAYGEMAVKAGAYYTNISEALGIDMSLFVKNGAMFEQMAKSLGLSSDAAYSLSTNLMAIGIDLASLTGHDLQDTWDALQSGVIAGQYKPLAKGYGINVTQSALSQTILTENSSMKEAQTALDDYTNNGLTDATIAQTALNEGITESVRNMDPMEKAYLRYKTVLNAARLAQGDMAKTLESPANQTRVFSSAVMGLSRAFGNVMIPILIRVIPYVTAFVSLLATAFNGLAKFFGFKPVDFANTPSLAPVVTTVTDLGDETDKTTGSVEALKKSIMGFDQFNILTSNKSSGGPGGPSTGGSPMPMDWGAYDLQLEKLVGGKTQEAMKAISDALAPLSESFGKLWDSLQPLIGQLKIFWDQYLVPIGQWVLGTGLPGMVDITTKLFTWFNKNPETAKAMVIFFAALMGLSKIATIAIGIKATMTGLGLLAPAILGKGGAAIAAGTLTIGATLAIAAASIGVAYIVGSLVVDAANTAWDKETPQEKTNVIEAGSTGNMPVLQTAIWKDLTEWNLPKALTDSSHYMQAWSASSSDIQKSENENLKRLEASGNYIQAAIDSFTYNILGKQTGGGKNILAEWKTAMETLYSPMDILSGKNTIFGKSFDDLTGQTDSTTKGFDFLKDGATAAFSGIKTSTNTLLLPTMNSARIATVTATSGVSGAFGGMPTTVRNHLATLLGTVSTGASNTGSALTNGVGTGVDAVVGALGGMPSSVKGHLSTLLGTVSSSASNTASALTGGIGGGVNNGINAFGGMPSSVRSHMSNLTGTVSAGAGNTGYALSSGIGQGIGAVVGGFSGLSGSTKPYLDSFGNSVSVASNNAGNSLINGSQAGSNGAIGVYMGFSNNVTRVFETLDSNIERIMVHIIQMMGTFPKTLSLSSILNSMSNLVFSQATGIRMYANGGFPEDGMFMANHGEMVGKFSNGRTAVANNVQIVEGIKYGVVSAIKSVGSGSSGGDYQTVYRAMRDALKDVEFRTGDTYLDGEKVADSVVKRINKKTSTSGLSPLKA